MTNFLDVEQKLLSIQSYQPITAKKQGYKSRIELERKKVLVLEGLDKVKTTIKHKCLKQFLPLYKSLTALILVKIGCLVVFRLDS